MCRHIILQKLRSPKALLQRQYGVSELVLFGSYPRNEQTPDSDIDIMVDFSKPVGIERVDMTHLLQEAFGNIPAQVVTRKSISRPYYNHLKSCLLYA